MSNQSLQASAIKNALSLTAEIEASGVTLRKQGKNLIGLCPFHNDTRPSLVVTPAKKLWNCLGACKAGGSVIDWVMRRDQLDFKAACGLLSQRLPQNPEPALPQLDCSDGELLDWVLCHYQNSLQTTEKAWEYLAKRGLNNPELISKFRLGFSDRSLGTLIPARSSKAGKILRRRLMELGILRERSGHEHLRGSLVIPVFMESGEIGELYGRKISTALRAGTPKHLYLKGEHRGIFNLAGLKKAETLILCESLIDSLTFHRHGFDNTSSVFGTTGLTQEIVQAIAKAHQNRDLRRIVFAYDADDAGERAAQKHAKQLAELGLECFRLQFPRRQDANQFALASKNPKRELEYLVDQARCIAGQKKPVAVPELPIEIPESEAGLKSISSLAAETTKKTESTEKPAVKKEPSLQRKGHFVFLTFGSRRYEIRGLEKNQSFDRLKVTIRVRHQDCFHMDSLDLYLYKQRKAFEIMASQELGLEQLVIKKDLGRILFQLEELQRERLDAEQEAKSKQIELSDAERDEAHELLLSANLMQQILDDFEACGIVGEESNKLVGYLACTSRKLNKPLAVLIQSSSAAGKSSLLESILAFMPPEEVEKFSAMTGQSLYYMGDSDLQHKILAVIEEEGAEKASYALKLLQSEGELMIASTGKDPNTGRHSTEEYQVKGPVALLLTTTSSETDEELANRCLVLTVDEGQQQTELIHRLQRDWDSLEEQIHSNLRAQILRRHQNAQRLLKPVLVSNPFRNDLTFRSDLTRTRRDHPKYLTLIRVIAFLHQCQREKKTIVKNGQDYQYIEVTLEDIEWANRLAHSVMGQSLDELTPQSRKLINAIYNMVLRIGESETIDLSEVRFTQREVREFTGWSQYQVKTHMRRLVEYEYLRLHRGRSGQSWLYELIYEPHKSESGRQMLGLIDVNKLRQRYDSNRVHSIKPMEHSEESREQPGVLGLHPVNFKKSKAL